MFFTDTELTETEESSFFSDPKDILTDHFQTEYSELHRKVKTFNALNSLKTHRESMFKLLEQKLHVNNRFLLSRWLHISNSLQT